MPSVVNALRASISRTEASAAACSAPASFEPLPPRVPKTTAMRLCSSSARATYGVTAASSSGCATTTRMSALKRSSACASAWGSCAAAAVSGTARNTASKVPASRSINDPLAVNFTEKRKSALPDPGQVFNLEWMRHQRLEVLVPVVPLSAKPTRRNKSWKRGSLRSGSKAGSTLSVVRIPKCSE